MPMPPPANESATGGRLSGDDMQQYMESFADKFLRGKIRYEVEVMKVIRSAVGQWTVKVQDIRSGEEELHFDKVVLCTGVSSSLLRNRVREATIFRQGCSEPNIPMGLDMSAVKASGFSGPVLHSSQFTPQLEKILSAAPEGTGSVVVIGGGKSAQECAMTSPLLTVVRLIEYKHRRIPYESGSKSLYRIRDCRRISCSTDTSAVLHSEEQVSIYLVIDSRIKFQCMPDSSQFCHRI